MRDYQKLEDHFTMLSNHTSKLQTLNNREVYRYSKSLAQTIELFNQWMELHNKILKLNDHMIDEVHPVSDDLDRELNLFRNNSGRIKQLKEEEIIKNINGLANQIQDDAKSLHDRLDLAERNLIEPMDLPMNDIQYLQLEVSKNRSSLNTVSKQAKDTLDDCINVINSTDNDTMTQLDSHQEMLQTLNEVDIPRITENIDSIFNYGEKTTQTKLHEDNKKNQIEISNLKQELSEFQKKIGKINTKIQEVGKQILEVKDNIKDFKDIEKEQQLYQNVINQLEEIEAQANKINDKEVLKDLGFEQMSLVEQKKNIIAHLNNLVNEFNANNQSIKQEEKVNRESVSKSIVSNRLSELNFKTKDIKKQTKNIEEKLDLGKGKALILDQRLAELVEKELPKFIKDLNQKTGLLEQKDAIIESMLQKIQSEEDALDRIIKFVNETAEKVKKHGDPEQIKKVMDIRDDLMNQKANLNRKKAMINGFIDKLDNMENNAISNDELLDAINDLKNIEKKLDKESEKKKEQEQKIKQQLNDLGLASLSNQLFLADRELQKTDIQIRELESEQKDLKRRLAHIKDEIAEAESQEFLMKDPEYREQVNKLKEQAARIEVKIKSVESQKEKLQRYRERNQQLKERLEQVDPDNIPEELELAELLEGVEQQKEKVRNSVLNQQEVSNALFDLETDLDSFKGVKDQKKKLEQAMQDLATQLGDLMQNFEDNVETNSELAHKLLLSCEEMFKDSQPDYTADYWEERHQINTSIDTVKQQINKLNKFRQVFNEKDEFIKDKMEKVRKSGGNNLQTIVLELKKCQNEI